MTDFLFDVIATELEDAVGRENCSTRTIDKLTHSVDFFWLSRMWVDRGLRMPEADFVVTNPTHIACALKYKAEEMESPMLIAKGTELIAKKIIDIAKEHGVPVLENAPVARALFKMVELNHTIPPEMYKAIAEILLFVYNMKKSTK